MNKTICNIKGCRFEGKYCRQHISGSIKKPAPIAPRSKKLAETMKKEYVPQVKEMVAANTLCKVQSPVCIKEAQGFHHMAGRTGKDLTGTRKIPCCNMCNSFIEQNDLWARNNGWKLSRLGKVVK